MLSISVPELQQKLATGEDIQLIDVRETWEHQAFNIGGNSFPLTSLFEYVSQIRKDKPVIVYCQKGIRSSIAIQRLIQRFHFNNLLNLTGGMEAWQKQKLSAEA
ncbi:MAG: rhodanese-like domain-containing protein [Bacteroidetes bacterium]|nr:rhodanese-like domain-containing protein [Bacteroidota bacterium]